MQKLPLTCITLLFLCLHVLDLNAIVLYDKGRLEISGIQLFQDSKNDKAYYYLPSYPTLSQSKNGDYEFLCIKYIGDNINESGGLFHALINYKLSSAELVDIEKLLKEKVPGAVLMGPVLIQEDPDNTNPSFRIISSILNSQQDTFLNSEVITSGKAPFLPGSKVAISSLLNTKAATLLWSTFESKTSDVSVVVEGYFPALVSGFSATVSANLEIVYNHFSSFQSDGKLNKEQRDNFDKGYEKAQIVEVLDSLSRTGDIKIEVADASLAYNIETALYKNLLDIITNRVTKMMFDTEDSWSKTPEKQDSVASDGSKVSKKSPTGFDRQSRYTPRNTLKLKTKNSINSFVFNMTIDQSTAIKVPVYSAGNIGGFYNSYSEDNTYFKIVDMDDPAFQSRDLHFQINSAHSDCFRNGFDNASILIKKSYKDTTNNSFTETLRFNASQIDSGEIIQKCEYKRLGEQASDWLSYEYKVAWHLEDIDTSLTTDWIETDMSSISIHPPLERRTITIDLDRSILAEYGIQSARIRFGIKLAGHPQMTKMKVLRKTDPLSTDEIVIYHDKDEPIAYQVNWYAKGKEIVDEIKLLNDDYIFLIPQEPKK